MSDAYHHGVKVTESATGLRALRTASTSIMGFVAVADDANAGAFPLNKRVLVDDLHGAIAKAGDEGSLASTLEEIDRQTNGVAVVVRVAEGEDAAETEANVIAGVQLLLGSAGQFGGIKPRILGAPGYDTQLVAAELAITARKLRGMAYASAAGDGADTIAEAITYRAEFAQRELMLIYPDFQRGTSVVNATATALGIRARIDHEQGWHKTISNVAVDGVTGISEDVHWDLQESDTPAGLLNAADITTLIHSQGYRFWGSRTCSDDPLFAFESFVRTSQVLQDTIAAGCMWAMDRPLHPSLARDLLEMINAKFRSLTRAGYIAGAEASMDPDENPKEELFAGKLRLRVDYTALPPLEQLGITQAITDKYFADFAKGTVTAA